MTNNNKWPIILGVLIVTFVWVVLTPRLFPQTQDGDISAPYRNFSAPAFSLPNMNGEQVELQDYSGKVVLLNFWASWCPPCRVEMPAMQRVYDSYQSQAVEIIAINMTHQDSIPDVWDFIGTHELTFPILRDERGDAATLYQVRALPTTFIIDQQGLIREVVVGGPLTEAFLDAQISLLLEEVD